MIKSEQKGELLRIHSDTKKIRKKGSKFLFDEAYDKPENLNKWEEA